MALNIRNPEAEKLASELARQTGESKTEAVTKVLRDRLVRVRRERNRRRLVDELEEIAEHCSRLPVLDGRPADEILGYDEGGSATLMVIDTSAVPAILQREPERRSYLEAIEAADTIRMSIASFVESSMVIESRYGAEGSRDLDRFLSRASVDLIAVDAEQGQPFPNRPFMGLATGI